MAADLSVRPSSSSSLPPLPPPGYSSLRVSPGQILLPLTISNKCGQSFRWRGVKVWERARQPHNSRSTFDSVQPKLEEDTKGASTSIIKEEPGTRDTDWMGLPDADHGEEKYSSTSNGGKDVEEWTEYSFCLADRVVFVRQDESRNAIYHRSVLAPPQSSSLDAEPVNIETAAWLRDYLNLDVPLEDLYEEWKDRDKVFGRFGKKFRGIRMLRQDPWECLCAFICSSNNNIARIGQMVQNLCTHYSPKLVSHTYDSFELSSPLKREASEIDEPVVLPMTIDYHPFPSPQALAQPGVEANLRELGFGYRAKYIHQTAKMLCEAHPRIELDRSVRSLLQQAKLGKTEQQDSSHSVHSYLRSLRSLTYAEARSELMQLQGVGPKVADCILLMSLDQASSIPVDRHVFQFAAKWYGLRNAKYEALADYFRNLWGEYAGWAHSVLFTADLRAFKGYDGTIKKEELIDDGINPISLKQDTEATSPAAGYVDPAIHPKVEVTKETVTDTSASRVTREVQPGRSISGRRVQQQTTAHTSFHTCKAESQARHVPRESKRKALAELIVSESSIAPRRRR